jgi:hypothetical protein
VNQNENRGAGGTVQLTARRRLPGRLARAISLAHHCRTVTDPVDEAHTAVQLDDLERRATATYLTGTDAASEELWIRAHRESLRARDLPRAARCIFWLVLDLFNRGEWARGNGWLARGLHLLEPAQDSAALGLLWVLTSRHCLKQGDTDAAAQAAMRAVDLCSQFEDPQLTVFSRLALDMLQSRRGQ